MQVFGTHYNVRSWIRNAARGKSHFLKSHRTGKTHRSILSVIQKGKRHLNTFSALLLWISQLLSCCSPLTFSFEVGCFHFRHKERFGFLRAWCKKTQFLSLQTLGTKTHRGTTAEWVSTGSKCRTGEDGCELVAESGRGPQRGPWQTPQLWWARGQVFAGWHSPLTGLGLVAMGSAAHQRRLLNSQLRSWMWS